MDKVTDGGPFRGPSFKYYGIIEYTKLVVGSVLLMSLSSTMVK